MLCVPDSFMFVVGRHCSLILVIAAALGSTAAARDSLKDLTQQAFELHQEGKFSEALPVLRRAYRLDSHDYFVNLLMGIDLLRTGEAAKAVLFLKAAGTARPNEEFPNAYLGEAWAAQKRYGDAAEAYLKAVYVAPGAAEASVAFVDFALARFTTMSSFLRSTQTGLATEYRLRALGAHEEDTSRRQLLEHAADLDPSAPGIWSDLAEDAWARGDSKAAELYAGRALQDDPNDLSQWMIKARTAAEASNWTTAAQQINATAQRSAYEVTRSLRTWPADLLPPSGTFLAGAAGEFFSCVRTRRNECEISTPSATSIPADQLYREHRWEALTRLSSPNEPGAWLRRGIAYARTEDCPHAVPALERGLGEPSPDVYAAYLLSWCYSREAGRLAAQVPESDDTAVRFMRGDILLRLRGDAQAAMAEYQSAVTGHPHDPAALERLAESQFGAGKAEEAKENAQLALGADPQRLSAKLTLAKIAIQERDYPAAVPLLREFLKSNAGDSVARVEYAKACAQTGLLKDALQSLAPLLDGGYPDEKGSLHYLLGTVLKKLGRNDEAAQAFAKSQQLSEAFQQKSYRDPEGDAHP